MEPSFDFVKQPTIEPVEYTEGANVPVIIGPPQNGLVEHRGDAQRPQLAGFLGYIDAA